MKVFDEFTIKAIEKNHGFKIIRVSPNDFGNNEHIYVSVTFEIDKIRLNTTITVYKDKNKQIQRVAYLMQRVVDKYKEENEGWYEARKHYKNLKMAIKDIVDIKESVNEMKEALGKRGNFGFDSLFEKYVQLYIRDSPRPKYDEIYQHCKNKLIKKNKK